MSKIFEALQRAEQERLLTGAIHQPRHAGAESNTASSTASGAEAEPILALPTIASPAPAALLPIATAAPAGALDWSRVVVSRWKPQLEKLPALEERGGAVEQFRSLRTRLLAFRDLNQLKTVMISSASPREGKSFIAGNLAVSFARHKTNRVLLIDGDMRRSSLHTLFGCQRTPGLATYLAGDAGITDVMQRPQVREDGSPLSTGIGSLTFIGGGDEGDRAADLSGSDRFQQLIDSVSPHFDWIIVDSSPVNLVTDGVNLAHACDAVLLVTRGGYTRFGSAQRALVELKASKVLGVVLNAVDTPPSTNEYYGYTSEDNRALNPGPEVK